MAADASQSGGRLADGWWRWFAQRTRLTLALLVLAALAPFLSKPFNFDDPLFLRAARQIQLHPTNPYGFEVNWYGSLEPMWKMTKNPPLASYYSAFWAMILGWSEVALHAAFLLPAVAVILGTHRLAARFCGRPVLAACVTLFTPAFLVSANTVMCDTLMLAFWIWAVALWVEGMDDRRVWKLAVSGVLVALAALSKYFGVCVLPLLVVYSVVQQRRVGWWAVWFLAPVIAIVAYEWATRALYGKGLFLEAEIYASAKHEILGMPKAAAVFVTLTFTGGSFAVAAFLAPVFWRAWTLGAFAVVAAFLGAMSFVDGTMSETYGHFLNSPRWWVAAQMMFWAAGGVSVLGVAATDAWRRRDAPSWLLGCWVVGTFAFTAFFNWGINARSLLPMAPAVGILMARRLEERAVVARKMQRVCVRASLACGVVLALAVAWADFELARAVRRSAEAACGKRPPGGRTLWFEGHWGFQYYMEAGGAKAVAANWNEVEPGDVAAIPLNNSNTARPDGQNAREQEVLSFQGPRWLATSRFEVGAGFYTAQAGPLPFAFGRVPPETVMIYVLGTTSGEP